MPHDTVLVEREEGPLFISNLVNLPRDDVSYNLAVTLAFMDCGDFAGSFKLPVFDRHNPLQ